MTTAVVAPTVAGAPHSDSIGSRVRWAVSDTLTVTKRNILSYTRIPEALFFSTVQPIMFVLLFRYVFGGAINVPGTTYVNYLMPGIFVQTVAFGSVQTSIGLAEDLQKGLIERFRALPMARSAVLAGRTTADLCRNILTVVIVTVVGFLVGFRPPPGCSPTWPASWSSSCSPTPSRGGSRSSGCPPPTARWPRSSRSPSSSP